MFDPDLTAHQHRLDATHRAAVDAFGNVEDANTWMALPNRSFGNKSPIEMMDTDANAAVVMQILNAIVTGGVA